MIRIAVTFFLMLVVQQVLAEADPMSILSDYSGNWTIDIEHFDTQFSKARIERTLLRNECWRSGSFCSCRQIVDGDEKGLIVYSHDAAKNLILSFPITVGSATAGSGTVLIKGNVLIFPWDDVDDGHPVHFRVINTFTDARHIEFRQEFSQNGEDWVPMARGSESKVD